MMKRHQHDYYQILGLPKSASTDDIKHAYRKLAFAHHPDKAQNKAQHSNTQNDGQMTLINEAYATLKNPKKRAEYDAVYAVQFGAAAQFLDKLTQELSKSPTLMTKLTQARHHAHTLSNFAQHQFDKIAPRLFDHAKHLSDKFAHLMTGTPTLIITPTLARQGGQVVFCHHGQKIRTTLPQGLTHGSQIKLTIDGQAVWFVLDVQEEKYKN